ncbi:MAG TPA: hypothetical protein VJL89_02630 [Thermodesulfovibrionia bacterium]|nr:hypothetical protein [Thermodesulfovibrionia bacterium]
MVKKVINWLNEARTEAEKLVELNLGIYSMTRLNVEVQSPCVFIAHIDNSLKEIQKRVGHFLEEKDDYPIEAYDDTFRLFCANAGTELSRG